MGGLRSNNYTSFRCCLATEPLPLTNTFIGSFAIIDVEQTVSTTGKAEVCSNQINRRWEVTQPDIKTAVSTTPTALINHNLWRNQKSNH